jgi:hypothetical protein
MAEVEDHGPAAGRAPIMIDQVKACAFLSEAGY